MKYRIKQVNDRYYYQYKFLLWWRTYTDLDGCKDFTFDKYEALNWLNDMNTPIKEVVEYYY